MALVDAFNVRTYTSPATVASMMKLRQFISDYFTQNICLADPGSTQHFHDDHDRHAQDFNIQPFLGLITYSPAIFARARAVIPQLQISQHQEVCHPNPNIEALLMATMDLRGQQYGSGEELPEEVVWQKHREQEMECKERDKGVDSQSKFMDVATVIIQTLS